MLTARLLTIAPGYEACQASPNNAHPGPAASRKYPCQLVINRMGSILLAPANRSDSSGQVPSPVRKLQPRLPHRIRERASR